MLALKFIKCGVGLRRKLLTCVPHARGKLYTSESSPPCEKIQVLKIELLLHWTSRSGGRTRNLRSSFLASTLRQEHGTSDGQVALIPISTPRFWHLARFIECNANLWNMLFSKFTWPDHTAPDSYDDLVLRRSQKPLTQTRTDIPGWLW